MKLKAMGIDEKHVVAEAMLLQRARGSLNLGYAFVDIAENRTIAEEVQSLIARNGFRREQAANRSWLFQE